jgi:hypothetical protein
MDGMRWAVAFMHESAHTSARQSRVHRGRLVDERLATDVTMLVMEVPVMSFRKIYKQLGGELR